MSGPRLGVLGGTFDPVHHGHLDAAEAARGSLALTNILFVPAHDPPHRTAGPLAGAFHRFALVSLAIDGRPGFRASDLELLREGRSYTVDTLRALHHRGWRPWQLFFILGADAVADIATWKHFPDVLDAANFAVITRPGAVATDILAQMPELGARARTPQTGQPADQDRTGVYFVAAETRDISSTAIRARLAARQPIDDLVPAPVARHILAHHLYELADALHGTNEGNSEQSGDDTAGS